MTRRRFVALSLGSCLAPSLSLRLAAQEAADVPWLADVQRPPEKLPDEVTDLSPLLATAKGDPIATLARWKERRAELRKAWLEFLGPVAQARRRTPAWTVLEEERLDDGAILRQRIRYDSELEAPDDPVEAYLLKPAKTDGRRPGVAVFHSTVDHSILQPSGVEGRPEKAFGLKLARRGYVTLSPRNYLWPANRSIAANAEAKRFLERHTDSKGMAKMLSDAQLAADILAALPEVDSRRLGAVGHSLGAKEVLYLAAFDARIRVTVSSEGGIGTRFSNWDAPWYLGASIKERSFHREHHELLALVAPRAFLLIGGESADGARSWPFIERALEVYRLHGEPARVGLLNHGKGHAVPQEAERKIEEWFAAYL